MRAPPPKLQGLSFFNCWTCKEAFVNARGEGLSLPLDSFDVSLVPGQTAALLEVRDDPAELNRRTLRELMPAPGHVGAVVGLDQDWLLSCFQLEGNLLNLDSFCR